jgi:hypothetical protein
MYCVYDTKITVLFFVPVSEIKYTSRIIRVSQLPVHCLSTITADNQQYTEYTKFRINRLHLIGPTSNYTRQRFPLSSNQILILQCLMFDASKLLPFGDCFCLNFVNLRLSGELICTTQKEMARIICTAKR